MFHAYTQNRDFANLVILSLLRSSLPCSCKQDHARKAEQHEDVPSTAWLTVLGTRTAKEPVAPELHRAEAGLAHFS